MRSSRVYVRGLPLPVLLVESMASGEWPPRDGVRLRAAMPWVADPVELLADVEGMRRESARWTARDDAAESPLRVRGGRSGELVELPRLDADLAVTVGVTPGGGAAVVLDYRTGSGDPRVVAFDRWSDPHRHAWRVVAPAFSVFAAALGVRERRLYRYVGPEEIRAQARPGERGHPVASPGGLAAWLARQDESEREEPFTFVVDRSATLRLAPRRSEHVVCAGGDPVLGAGEIAFAPDGDGWRVSEISNQSTGYCPDLDSWSAVQDALEAAGLEHPGRFTSPVLFRRCTDCGQLNIVKDGHYVCAMCDGPLPASWNADSPEKRTPRRVGGVAVGDVVSGTVVDSEPPFGPRVRLDGTGPSPSAHIRDLPWRGGRPDPIAAGRRVTAEVVDTDEESGHVWPSLAATEHPDLWRFLKGLRVGDVLTGSVADIRDFGVFVALDEGPPHPSHPGVGFVAPPEPAWEYFDEITDVVRPGRRVRGEVVAVDTRNGEARLSLRALRPDPFQVFAEETAPGRRLTGTVTKVAPPGAFVEVADGIQGLLRRDGPAPAQDVRPGDVVEVAVLDVDREHRRLLLSLARGPGAVAEGAA